METKKTPRRQRRETPQLQDPEYAVVVGKSANGLRCSRALQIVYGEEPIINVGGPIWSVPSQTECKTYTVNIDRKTCECPYFRSRRLVCKHIEAVRIYKSKILVRADPSDSKGISPYKNAAWYDYVAEHQFDLLVPLLKSLGTEINRLGTASERAQ